jgi:aspartate racemase
MSKSWIRINVASEPREMAKSKHVGIVAVSAEGAALCYKTICVEGEARFGRYGHPEISMHTYPLAEYMRHIDSDRWDEVGRLLLSSATNLVNAGAEILVCPDNTVHQALDRVRAQLPAPWLHIAEEVAAVAAKSRFQRLGILGTRYLMEGPVYRAALASRNIAFEIPEPVDRERINAIIFDELVQGEFSDYSRKCFQGVIEKLARRRCDAVVLGCTEIPLLVSEADSQLPVIDSTRTLARAALREAMATVAI